MSFIKKTWLARLGVGLNRFRMNNSTDVVLESNPVSVTQAGDQLSADNMNNLETRIGNAFDEVENDFDKMAGNLAPIEVSPATTNHAVGSQIVYNGILYKVTSAISTGDNLVVGTNISPYPVSSAISDIIEYGSNSNGGYIKCSNGVLICFKNYDTGNLTGWSTWGSLYAKTISSLGAMPYDFIDYPSVFKTIRDGYGGWINNASSYPPTKTSWGGVEILRPTTGEDIVYTISLLAIGRWK